VLLASGDVEAAMSFVRDVRGGNVPCDMGSGVSWTGAECLPSNDLEVGGPVSSGRGAGDSRSDCAEGKSAVASL
jgi:hypothetical protein